MRLKNIEQIDLFLETVNKCEGNVWLVSPYGDQYNLKSAFTQYVAIGKILGEFGDEMELYADKKADEWILLDLFMEHPEYTNDVSIKRFVDRNDK